MAPKFALFLKGSKLPLNKGFKNMFELDYSLAINPRIVSYLLKYVYKYWLTANCPFDISQKDAFCLAFYFEWKYFVLIDHI